MTFQKHVGLHLDQNLDFNEHINKKVSKAQKGILVIKKNFNVLLICKSFVQPHLGYGNIVINQTTRVFWFSIMLPLQVRMQLKELLEQNPVKNRN